MNLVLECSSNKFIEMVRGGDLVYNYNECMYIEGRHLKRILNK